MDIRQLRYFIEICNTGSINKAAENIFISQQGISSAIKRLENELGCNLFYRKSNGLVLTKQGEYLKLEAEAILEKINKLHNYFDKQLVSKELISVACTYNLISRLPKAVQKLLMNQDEDFEIKFKEFITCECEEKVNNEEYSFGIVYGSSDQSKFNVFNLFSLEQCLIVHKEHPLANQKVIDIRQLDSQKMIFPTSKTKPYSILIDLFNSFGIKPNIILECDRPLEIIQLLNYNNYLLARIIKDDVNEEAYKDLRILHIKNVDFMLPVSLIQKRSKKLTVGERYFKQYIINNSNINY